MAQIQLPELSLGADLLQETWEMLQLFLNLMLRAVVIYLVCIGILMMITNLLSTFACGLFALVALAVAAGILETVCPDVVLSAEVELAICVVTLLIPEIILLNRDPSDDGASGPSFSEISKKMRFRIILSIPMRRFLVVLWAGHLLGSQYWRFILSLQVDLICMPCWCCSGFS